MTIVGLAQNFVGSNNLNLLQPLGQFGTRLHGGKDSASPRYIFTMLRSVACWETTPNLTHTPTACILSSRLGLGLYPGLVFHWLIIFSCIFMHLALWPAFFSQRWMTTCSSTTMMTTSVSNQSGTFQSYPPCSSTVLKVLAQAGPARSPTMTFERSSATSTACSTEKSLWPWWGQEVAAFWGCCRVSFCVQIN